MRRDGGYFINPLYNSEELIKIHNNIKDTNKSAIKFEPGIQIEEILRPIPPFLPIPARTHNVLIYKQ